MAHTLVENKVIENAITTKLNTKLDTRSLMTIDDSLTTQAGLKKVINKYTYTGLVEKLTKGAKNTAGAMGTVGFTPKEYTVERYQHTFKYNEMDAMQDPMVLDVCVDGASKTMANEINTEYFTELAKITKKVETAGALTYDLVVDALQEIGCEAEEDTFIIMGSDIKAKIRKDAEFKASRQGEILYNGQFGSVSGVPCIFSKLVPANTAYVTKKSAVKFFVKKEGGVEQDKDIETKDITTVYDRFGLVALVDDTESVKIVFKTAAV